eukprot:scaffold8966_cov152-Amphora_coffeaeformis.AAC.1
MAENDDNDSDFDISSNEGRPSIRRRTYASIQPVERRISPRNPKKTKSVGSERTSLPSTEVEIKEHLSRLQNRIKGLSFSQETSMRVINAALTLKLEHLESERKKSTKKGAFVRERTMCIKVPPLATSTRSQGAYPKQVKLQSKFANLSEDVVQDVKGSQLFKSLSFVWNSSGLPYQKA